MSVRARVYIHVCANVHASKCERKCDCVCASGFRLVCDDTLKLNNALLNFKELKVLYELIEE